MAPACFALQYVARALVVVSALGIRVGLTVLRCLCLLRVFAGDEKVGGVLATVVAEICTELLRQQRDIVWLCVPEDWVLAHLGSDDWRTNRPDAQRLRCVIRV